jgi:hypothetical protein
MDHTRRVLLSIIWLCLVLADPPLLADESHPIDHWFVDSLVKVFPEDAAGKNALGQAVIVAARNSHVSLQLAMRAHRNIENLTASVEKLEEHTGDKVKVQVRLVGYVLVVASTKDAPPSELVHAAPGLFPDVLSEQFPFTLKPNKTQVIWLTLEVSGEARPGDYLGEVVVREAGSELLRAPFMLKVAAATVPAQQTLKVTNWFYLSDFHLKPFFGTRVFTEEWWKLLGKIGRVMAEHRQNVMVTPLTGFYFSELPLIQARLGPGGLEYDFSNFDRWVETFQEAGVIGYIEGSHLLRRGEDLGDSRGSLRVDVYVPENGKAVFKSLTPNDPRAESALAEMLSALCQHLKQKGWLNVYYQHILDEVSEAEMPLYAKYAGIARRSMPGVLTMDAMDGGRDLTPFEGTCDIWVPSLGTFNRVLPRLKQHSQQGGEVWFYTAGFPSREYPNRFIDYSLVKVRLLHWMNYRYGLTGYLHWGGNYWTPDPISETGSWNEGGFTYTALQPGDAFITYPDRERKTILSSIRLEAMCEGIEDYELLRELEKRDPAVAEGIASKMVRSFTDYVRDPAEFRRLHRELLQTLSRYITESGVSGGGAVNH